ncbi:HNH endonuclease signature motif containing protein [Mycobacterium sp. DL440]|uniref:HNH endonuclease signature motif containing protein n=1 Tax=Mycobacterium sp. DL440 TaxID=2675523 RepID=UPI00141E19AA|nr:HNH endonuclease signature motif containing protein [Mycobacterium sp. DL440]
MFDTDSDVDLIDKISAGARAESAAIAGRLAAIGALDSLREQELAESIFWRTDPFEEVAAEISAALRISRNRAGTQVHHARVLRDKLPMVAARFAAGDIDYRVVRTLIARTGIVDPAVWAGLDAELAARAHRWMRFSDRQLRDRVDQWIAKLDPNGVRVPPEVDEERFVQVEPSSPGMASIWANVHAEDGVALSQRLDAVANTVCVNDPRTLEQRRADAVGPLARLESQLPCRCRRDDCPAAQMRAAADAAMVHVLANESTLDGSSDDPGYLPGHGILPAESVRNLAATARRKPVVVPTEPTEPTDPAGATTPGKSTSNGATEPTQPREPAKPGEPSGAAEPGQPSEPSEPGESVDAADGSEPQYRPSVALSEFIRWRDLTCRFPGCDAPVARCDIDHTAPWPAGPTHPSNTKLFCRAHHLVKTFCPGWSDRQLPDGTIEFTAPTGHTYVTEPHGAGMFPTLATPTGDLNLPEPQAPHPDRGAKMPTRRQTREQDRQDRIAEERRLRAELNNDLDVEYQYQIWLAEEYGPPPPF